MRVWVRRVAWVPLFLLLGQPAVAQDEVPLATDAWRIGVAVAAGSQPDAVLPVCRARSASSAIGSLGISAGRAIGGLHLEGRIVGAMRAEIMCVGGGPIYEGVVTRSEQTAAGGSRLLTSDVRIRFGAGQDDLFTTALGAGWAWGKSTPFVSWSLGTRGGEALRWGIDAEVRSYFAPWRRQTTSYAQGDIISVLVDERFRRAAFGFTVGVVLELPLWRQ